MPADLSGLNDVINQHLAELTKPGVLSVRPGYKVTGDWLTSTPAIVVTVAAKKAQLPTADLVPAEVGGVPTDVRQASPRKRKELEDPQGYAQEYRLTPPWPRPRPRNRNWTTADHPRSPSTRSKPTPPSPCRPARTPAGPRSRTSWPARPRR